MFKLGDAGVLSPCAIQTKRILLVDETFDRALMYPNEDFGCAIFVAEDVERLVSSQLEEGKMSAS